MAGPRWKRVLLKLSGEAFAGQREFGLDPATVKAIAREVASASAAGLELAVVEIGRAHV